MSDWAHSSPTQPINPSWQVWDARMLGSSSSTPGAGDSTAVCLSSASTNARITCLCAVQPYQPTKQHHEHLQQPKHQPSANLPAKAVKPRPSIKVLNTGVVKERVDGVPAKVIDGAKEAKRLKLQNVDKEGNPMNGAPKVVTPATAGPKLSVGGSGGGPPSTSAAEDKIRPNSELVPKRAPSAKSGGGDKLATKVRGSFLIASCFTCCDSWETAPSDRRPLGNHFQRPPQAMRLGRSRVRCRFKRVLLHEDLAEA